MGIEEPVRQLPRGNHRLARDEVLASQRGRMLLAVAAAAAEKGFAATTVADVLSRAKVSRETFYEHFDNKKDCFLAAYDTGIQATLDSMAAAVDAAQSGGLEALSAALTSYLDGLVENPDIARTFLIEIYAAGPDALPRRVAVHEQFIDAVHALLDEGHGVVDRFDCELLVGSITSIATLRVATGDLATLAQLHGPIMDAAARLVAPSEQQMGRRGA